MAVEEVARELARGPLTHVHFSDDLFTNDPEWLREFAPLYRRTVGVPFTERSRTIAANTVVLVTYNHPNRELANYLREEDGPWAVHLVGDVNGTNGILQAVHSAAAVARSI